jgi:hypothetical protein
MDALLNILTILNLCSVQFFGTFDTHTSLYQSIVPAVIVSQEIHTISQKTQLTLESIQPASLSQKCLKSGTGLIAFISVNGCLTPNISADPFQNEYMLHRYTPLLEQASKYSNPAVVLLQIHTTIKERNLKFDWMKLHITSQLLLFDAETIYRPTIDPGPSLRISIENPMILRSDTSQLRRIKTLQEEKTPKKLNLNNRFIKFTSALSRRNFFDCSLNLDRVYTNPHLCIISILEKQINFTTTQPRQTPRYFLLRLFKIPAENDWNDIIISNPYGLQWLSYGVDFEPYKLILITKLQSVKVDSLLQPFDRNMWMALILANCLFFIVVCVESKFKEKQKLVLWMISTIFSQTDDNLTQHFFNKKRLINIALVSSWFFSIFLLTVLYQGDLYSYLSNVDIPILPNSLREILVTNIPLFTFGQICNSSDQPCSSILLQKLIPDILKTREAQENLKNVASKVLNRTEHIPGYHPLFISLDIAINLDKLRTLKKAITPNTFGMLASSSHIDEFNIVAKMLFKEHIVRQTHDINPFIAMIPWATQRGPFATAFSSGIGRLSQSGLVERWSRNLLIGKVMFTTQHTFKSMHDLENKLVDESTQKEARSQSATDPLNWEGYGRLYSKFMLVPDKISNIASVQSVPLLVMTLPFLACLVLTCFAILVFLIECVAKKIRRSMIKKSQIRAKFHRLIHFFKPNNTKIHILKPQVTVIATVSEVGESSEGQIFNSLTNLHQNLHIPTKDHCDRK